MAKTVTRYVTKYALSQGIIKVQGKILGPSNVFFYGGQLSGNRGRGIDTPVQVKDYFTSRQEAEARAHQLLQIKIDVLERQVNKLKSIQSFPVIDMTKR